MGILIRTVGSGANTLPNVKKATGLLSDGSVVMLVPDHNQAGIPGDGGDETSSPKWHIYHSVDRTNWTLKGTISIAGTYPSSVASMCVDSANNIHATFRSSNAGSVWYTKATYNATGPTWSIAGSVSLSATPPAGYTHLSNMDIDTIGNSTECVVVSAYWYNPTAGAKKVGVQTYVRTTAGVWVTHPVDLQISGDSAFAWTDDITVAGDNFTAIGGDNVGVFSYYVTRKTSAGTDLGDNLYVVRVNCSTGARIATHLIQSGIYKGAGGGFRKFWLFNTASNRFDLAGVIDGSDFKIGLYRFTWNRATNTATSNTPVSSSAGRSLALTRSAAGGFGSHNWASVAYNGQGKFFYFANSNIGAELVVTTAEISAANKITFGTVWNRWDNGYGSPAGTYDNAGRRVAPTVAPVEQLFSGANRNWGTARLDVMTYHHRPTNGSGPQSYRMEARGILPPLTPSGITPAASSTVPTDRPAVSVNHKLQWYYAQVLVKAEWQIASDAGFTTNLKTITESDSDFIVAVGTSTPYNAIVKSTEVLDAIEELYQGTWYIRARTIDYAGNISAWSSSQTFSITHPPVGADLYPTSGAVFLYAGAGNATFTWKFTDPSPYDNQTAYQIVVENASDGTILVDSGKVTSTAKSATVAIPVGGKDIELRWKLTLWDSDNVVGPTTAYQVFYVADPPVPVISSPADSEVLSSGIPTVTWTPGLGGTKTQIRYRIFVTQGSNVIYSSNWVESSSASHTLPIGYLRNDQQYTIRVEVQDNLGLQGFDDVAVSTDWIEPVGPTSDWEVYVHEFAKRGFVYITWTDANMDDDFASWNVYRRKIGEASWTLIGTHTSGAGRYAHRDYFVSSGRSYEYTITQMVDRFGDYIESSPAKVVRVTPDADNYWLIDSVLPSQSIPLYQVTADPFSEEYEQETYNIIGVGRHVEYGDRLGYIGSISAQLRDKFITGSPRENYLLNPAMSYRSNNGEMPDEWSYSVAGVTGNVSFASVETRNPSPTGKSPFRLYSDGVGETSSDRMLLQQVIDGTDLPSKMTIPGTTVVLSFWIALSDDNANKAYRIAIDWLDGSGATASSVDSGPLTETDAVESYLPEGSIDAANTVGIWKRLRFITTVPGTPPAGARVKIQLEGTSGVGATPGQLIVGGGQFEVGSMTTYFDGDEFGGDWSGTPYLSYSFGTGYYTARQQRQALERIKAQKTWVYLRNPFGDLWRVAPSDISVQRIAGVGKAEFTDVDMPYQEVAF